MDEDFINLLKVMKDKEKARLFAGFYRFFNSRFPPEMYNLEPKPYDDGYHMKYLNVEYIFDFEHEGSEGSLLNPARNITFKLKADLQKKDDKLEQRIRENKISNHELDKTKYLADQRINSNGECVSLYCRIKKTPKEESEINELCSQLWNYIIKNIFSGIHKV